MSAFAPYNSSDSVGYLPFQYFGEKFAVTRRLGPELDWLDKTTPHIFWSAVCNHPMNPEGECAVATGPNIVFYAKTYRAAIDAVRAAK